MPSGIESPRVGSILEDPLPDKLIGMPCSCCDHGADSKPFEPFINEATLHKGCPLDNKRNRFEKEVITPKDVLQALPAELYHACLKYLDVESLTTLRRVSQYTRSSVDSLHEYQEVYRNAPQALRACLATGVASDISLLRLHQSLISVECHYCRNGEEPQSNFGPYLCLFTGYRICLFCIRNDHSLKPVDLSTLLHLCAKRNSHISSISNLTFVHTIPGVYGPTNLEFQPSARSTILLGQSVKALPGINLTEKEERTLYGKSFTTIHHHPFVQSKDESNTHPGWSKPDADRHITKRYMSVIRLPYLSTSKKSLDRGVLCKECVLSMQYAEERWKRTQRERRLMGLDPVASSQRREEINHLRRAACRMFTTSEEAMQDAYSMIERGNLIADDLYMEGLSMQSHRLRHAREKRKLSDEEVLWREEQKGSPFPILGDESVHFA